MRVNVEERLRQLNIALPKPASRAGHYDLFKREGDLIQIAGVAPSRDGVYAFVGKVGRELTLEHGQEAARLCALNAMASMKLACDGDLNRVRNIVMVRGFVNATEDFPSVPAVINGASDLLVEAFGEAIGAHARTSIGCATLPSLVAVEIDVLFAVEREESPYRFP